LIVCFCSCFCLLFSFCFSRTGASLSGGRRENAVFPLPVSLLCPRLSAFGSLLTTLAPVHGSGKGLSIWQKLYFTISVIQWKAREITCLLAYRMGNAGICGDKADVDFVTVLRGNGTVLTFYNPMHVAVLLQGYPGHFVCHSSSLLLMHEGKILPPHTILAPGETYFLLPVPSRKSNSNNDSTTSSSSCPQRQAGLPQQEDSRTMKFALSNELFAKILSGSSMREDSLSKSSKRRRNEERTPLLGRLKSWEPRLCTVAEVTAK
jgi:hypothetical protein